MSRCLACLVLAVATLAAGCGPRAGGRPPNSIDHMVARLKAKAAARRAARDGLNLTHSTSFVVFPADCNALGGLFGGKTLAEMDRAAAVTVRRLLYASQVKDAVTVGVAKVSLLKAGAVKDLVFVTGAVTTLGEKTVGVAVKVERELDGGKRELLAEGTFTFAAYDAAARKAVPHGLKLAGR